MVQRYRRLLIFFVFDCSKDVSKIHSEYRKRFLHDFYPKLEVDPQEASLEDCRKVYIDSLKKDVTDNSKILHYQRRLLVQFFMKLVYALILFSLVSEE